jgi:hypothetical protein
VLPVQPVPPPPVAAPVEPEPPTLAFAAVELAPEPAVPRAPVTLPANEADAMDFAELLQSTAESISPDDLVANASRNAPAPAAGGEAVFGEDEEEVIDLSGLLEFEGDAAAPAPQPLPAASPASATPEDSDVILDLDAMFDQIQRAV